MNSIRKCNRLLSQRTVSSFTFFNASSSSSFNKNNRNLVYISNNGFNTHNSCNISYKFKPFETNNNNYVNSQLKNLEDHDIKYQKIEDCIIKMLHFFLGETIPGSLFKKLKNSATFPYLEEDDLTSQVYCTTAITNLTCELLQSVVGLSEDLILKLARVFVHNKSDIYTISSNENIPTELLQYFHYDENSDSYSIPNIFFDIFFKLLVAKSEVLKSQLYTKYSPLYMLTDRDGQGVNGKNFERTILTSLQFFTMLQKENEGKIGLNELATKAIYPKGSELIMDCNLNEPISSEILDCLRQWLLHDLDQRFPNTFQLSSSDNQKGIDGVYVCGDVAIFIQCKCSKGEKSITDKEIETIITKIEEELIKQKVSGKFKVIIMIITNRKVSSKVQKKIEQGGFGHNIFMICKDHGSENEFQNVIMGIEKKFKEIRSL